MSLASYETLETPIGELFVLADETRLLSIGFRKPDGKRVSNPVSAKAIELLDDYFRGERPDFSVLPFKLPPQPFYKKVLLALLRVEYARTLSYGSLAALAGNPKAYRAAACAVSRNPFAIAIACHRVLHASGGVGAYGWGASKKAWLLNHEKINAPF
ncbi:MAG: methylated-DNA--[protein]-cysteine S-methyltransferase [Helicobacteraceae bacterium]|nr:methylated-DNA--[protein]-cysteine S-methyltransferase [Helicobacteraceae bacterium]